MIKKYLSFLFFIFFLAELYSMPVLRKEVTFTQPDGSSFVAYPWGDEWQNGYETKDGYTILFDEDSGYWVYALVTEEGELVKSDRIVGLSLPGVPVHLRPALSGKPDRVSGVQPYTADRGPVVPATGNHRVLVILTKFTNRQLSTTEAQWADIVFNSGSFSKVRHFYKEVSYNNIDLLPAAETCGTTNDGVATATLNYAHPNTVSIGDQNKQLTMDALVAVDGCVNFASFDDDGNGYISTDELHIVVVVAGYEASYGGASSACSPSVWAHRWVIDPLQLQLDSKRLAALQGNGDYTQFGEWHCASWDTPGHMATIGVIAHELGHSLWLPDEYDTDDTSSGIGNWGLMGIGSWNSCSGGYLGNCPSHPTAWDKWYLGWLTPTQVTGDGVLNIPDITTNQSAFYLRDNPGGVDWSYLKNSGSGEYFMLENRQLNGYNAGIPSCGLLIWHIWEGALSDNTANQNEAGRRLIDLREADGLDELDDASSDGDSGDPYPGSTNNTVFNDTSIPSSKLYCASDTGFCYSSGVGLCVTSSCATTMSVTVGPDISVSPTSHDFGSVKVNESSTQVFTISNTCAPDLTISSISIYAGDSSSFSVRTGVSNPCATLAPAISAGSSCSVEVNFTPSSSGRKNSTLRIQSNDPDEETVDISLNGVGRGCGCSAGGEGESGIHLGFLILLIATLLIRRLSRSLSLFLKLPL